MLIVVTSNNISANVLRQLSEAEICFEMVNKWKWKEKYKVIIS